MKRTPLTHFSRSRFAGAFLATAAALLGHLPAGESQDLDAFAARIEAGLQDRCIGFGYAIYKGRHYVRGGGGGTREKIEGPYADHPFDQNTQKDCHSMSKTITAAAMIKALQIRGLGLDARIYDYFPKRLQDATPGGTSNNISNNLIRTITFEQMLAHKSGFAQSAKTWNQLVDELEDGLDYPPGNNGGGATYANWNYGMCRLLVPYVLHTNWFRNNENGLSKEDLEAMTAEIYTDFTRDRILKPAGAYATRTRPPQDPTAANFAYLYDFLNDEAEGIMPNRRLDLGSGGWAMSAREYGKFLVALFDEDLVFTSVKNGGVFVNALDEMKSKKLGMFTTRGSDNDTYYVHRGANSWSGNGGSVGGKSIWMHFPPNDITVVLQINSHKNAITAMGVERDQMLREAYDEVYADDTPSEKNHVLNMYVSRAQDGWIASRGVGSTGNLGSTDFDTNSAPGWSHSRIFTSAGRSFVLRYNPDNGNGNGSLQVQRLRRDGTLAEVTYSGDKWRRGWTHLEVFHKNAGQDTFLLLYDKNAGKIRTYRINDNGRPVDPRITDADATGGFDVLKIVRLNSQDHLLRYNSSSGLIHVRSLNNNGSWGPAVYEKNWKKGFTTFEFYQNGNGNQYLLRYKVANGHANILRFPPTVAGLEQTTEVLDQTWSSNWQIMRFFRTSEGTFNFRYNPLNGNVRIQEIRNNGTFGTVKYTKDGFWLSSTTASGPFDINTTGWDTVEFYQAKDAGVPNVPTVGNDKAVSVPSDAEGATTAAFPPPSHPRVVEVKRAQPTTTVRRGMLQLDWEPAPGVFYIAERSTDLQNWEPLERIQIQSKGSLRFQRQLPTKRVWDENGNSVPAPPEFYRIRTVETAPVVPEEPPARGPIDLAPPAGPEEPGRAPVIVARPQ